ncbi:hypothetical protein GW17_00000593 [Ensete ventricosum]|nr:hypothetical protein GW17_00000593 [Ensete ventricosum]
MGGISGFGSGSRLLEWWSSGRSLTPARRSGRQVPDVTPPTVKLVQWLVFAIPLPRRGARVYIVGVVDHMYLATRLPLWLTLSSYASTTPVVVAVRDAFTGRGIGLPCVRSTVRPLGYRPYRCQVDCTTAGNSALPVPGRPHDHWRPHTCVRPASRVGSITSVGQLSEGAMMWRPGHYVPYHQRTPVTLNILAEYTAKIDDKGIVDRRRAGIKATPGDSPRRREKRETLAPTLTYKRERFDTGERRQRHSHLKVLT